MSTGKRATGAQKNPVPTSGDFGAVLNALPNPVVLVGLNNEILYGNYAAQAFFQAGLSGLRRMTLDELLPFGSPVLSLIPQVRERRGPVNEYRVDIGTPKTGGERLVDVFATPLDTGTQDVVVTFQERTIADKIDRQLTHRSAARSVTGLASMLAHEIKNPLSGIRGAAQLLEDSASDQDKALTRLITEEADRIVNLVDTMEVFSDERPIEREAVNVHTVTDHVIQVAENGFARGMKITKLYDPSLPPVLANRNQLIQVFLNLVKNASEACEGVGDPEITITSAYRPGVRISASGSDQRIALPMEFRVIDNGRGVPEDLHPHLFDPFITTKTNGKGLGLALVAKIIGDHGGVIECQSQPKHTEFRILLPPFKETRNAKGSSHV
ncbi:MAG: ATP-binding protein [Pseudomonadota bacterium]